MGETALLLEGAGPISIEQIHESEQLIVEVLGTQLFDVVPAYQSITLFTNLSKEDVCNKLKNQVAKQVAAAANDDIVQIPICYEREKDLTRVSMVTGVSKNKIIERHLNGVYRVVLIGFTPGFVYADGLDESVACPRLENPRKIVEKGSVGIGGSQTGIYSLSSPGGWNIIGQTPVELFDKHNQPPMKLALGHKYQFFRISEEEFVSWES